MTTPDNTGGEVSVDLSAAAELKVVWVEPTNGKITSRETTKDGDKRILKTPVSGGAIHLLQEQW